MKRTGQLTVTGIQRDENGEASATELTAPAEYFEKGESRYLFYEESGETPGETVKSTVKFRGGVLELKKQGQVETRMIFEPGHAHRTLYTTPFGAMPLDIRTEETGCSSSETEVLMHAAYFLTSGGLPLSRCEVFLRLVFT